MTPPSLKSRLAGGECLTGCFACIPHPIVLEVLSRQGPGVLCIDAEHGQIGRSQFEDLIRACHAGSAGCMIRLPSSEQEWIASALDAGADAILVPRVSSVEEARRIVAASYFAPDGVRGVGPGRASGYGYNIGGYVSGANERTLVAIQIETAEGFAAVAEICEVPGIDLVFVGPADLSIAIGAPGPENNGRLDAAIAHIFSTARAAGKRAGLFCLSADGMEKWRGQGASFFLVGSDLQFLAEGAGKLASRKRAMDL